MEVQVGARWRRSSYSGNGGGTCVEVGEARRGVLVRDTTDRSGPVLPFSSVAWRRFADQVRRSLAPGRWPPAMLTSTRRVTPYLEGRFTQ
jgi:hypothetical protein